MKKIILFIGASLVVTISACKKEYVKKEAVEECKSCNEVKLTDSRKMLRNDPILLNLLNNKEIKEINKSFGELNLNTATIYNSTINSNAAISIKFTLKTNENAKTTSVAVSNNLIVYLKNDAPNIITVQQLSVVNAQTTTGQIQYYSPVGDELLSLTLDNGKYTSIVKAPAPGDGNQKPRESWTECMKRAAVECSDDISCAITCIFMAEPCAIGFGIGCALKQ